MHRAALAVCAAATMLVGARASADDGAAPATSLTYDQAIALARDRAPDLQLARARIDEARAHLEGASAVLSENPSLDAGAGARIKAGGVTPDLDLSLTQRFELGGKRGARIDVANAEIATADLEAKDAERHAVRDAAYAYWRAVHATAARDLADRAVESATTVLGAVEKRADAGDVAALDVNVARGAVARARAERRAATAAERSAFGELRAVLGVEATTLLTLKDTLHVAAPPQRASIVAALDNRADLAATRANAATADAELRAGETSWWPDVGVGAAYAYDDGDHVVGGKLEVPIPLFQTVQGGRAEARARAEGLRRAFVAQRAASLARVTAALAALEERDAAVMELEENAGPAADENVRLARRSYTAGEMSLADLIVIEREASAVHRELLDALLEAVLTRVDLESEAGVLQ